MPADRRPFLLIAHRGVVDAGVQENTLPAFDALPAFAAVEFDIRLTADGIPVVCHDDRLFRVAASTAKVSRTPFAQLPLTRSRQPIPRLSDVLASLAGKDITVHAEIKDPRALKPALAILSGRSRVVVSSFDHDVVASAASAGFRTLALFERPTPSREMAAIVNDLGASMAGNAISAWRSMPEQPPDNIPTYIYTVNTAIDLAALNSAGFSGAYTDHFLQFSRHQHPSEGIMAADQSEAKHP